MIALFIDPNYVPEPKMDMCKCSNCGWSGKVSDCETEMESDGWEYPEYEIVICPKCDDGCVDDFWYSDIELQKEEIKKWDKYTQLET